MPSLLFIPDICGFTKFVNQTEITHSRHIISELLELIIQQNNLGMKVAEIEGDAVFFYKFQSLPTFEEIIQQIKRTFIAFHSHLKLYEHRRICPCGACSSAADLSLKFIVHAADFQFIEVQGKRKPYGPDVILVHRLLKNSIKSGEYALITDSFLQHSPLSTLQSLDKESLPHPIQAHTSYDDIGKVAYQYILLENLHQFAFISVQTIQGTIHQNPLRMHVFIKKPRELVYEVVSNLDFRDKWIPDPDGFEYEESKVNRIGTKHLCVIGNKKIEFETVTNNFDNNQLVYGEKLKQFPIVKEFTSYYILEEKGDGTKLTIEVHYKPLPVIGWILLPFFKKFALKNIKSTLELIKKVCENQTIQVY